ncbi:hypothetical protein VP1G_10582 [Cytospora mali]|uniref:Uncharacterized protein n=1 Tax=Cytospora mali TaxID=578113 RepID=A0A194UPU2_CYTMA|nr:hypothetical protein VP1G_10582 [Valsa mali var. pyri (nom. inval.)]
MLWNDNITEEGHQRGALAMYPLGKCLMWYAHDLEPAQYLRCGSAAQPSPIEFTMAADVVGLRTSQSLAWPKELHKLRMRMLLYEVQMIKAISGLLVMAVVALGE